MASKKNDELNEFTVNGSINYYNRHRHKCTAEDMKLAHFHGGQQHDIISNRSDHQVYFKNAKNPDHFVDDKNRATSDWWDRKVRVRRPGSDEVHVLDSRLTIQSLTCPPTAGKTQAAQDKRTAKQLCQAEAPLDYGRYTARHMEVTPRDTRTPEKDWTAKQLEHQHRKRDIPEKPPMNVTDRGSWLQARRSSSINPPPKEQPSHVEIYSNPKQLRAEPITGSDVIGSRFAHRHTTARMSGSQTARLSDEKRHESTQRLEGFRFREVTQWPFTQDLLTRDDKYYVKPQHRSGNPSVKYDILSNETIKFRY